MQDDLRFNAIVTHCLLFGIYYNVLKEDGVPRWATFLVVAIVYASSVAVAHLATRIRKP